MAGNRVNEDGEAVLRRVTALVSEAIDLLDAYGGSVEAAAHLALALQELQKARGQR